MIIPIYKFVGQSTHQIAKLIGKKFNTKATHTGTLDPMAQGVIIVLTGEDRFKKSEFSDWKKTYEFKILIGVSTDTHDLLGLQTQLIKKEINPREVKEKIENILPKFIGKQTQVQPKFSSQRINGESAFDKAKNNIKFNPKENIIEIFNLRILKTEQISLQKLENYLNKSIKLVNGNFRQEEILKNWNQTLNKFNENNLNNLLLIKIKAVTSKKTYIRALTRDIAKQIKTPATTFSITRTNQGEYSKSSCKYIDEDLLNQNYPKL